MLLRAGVEVEDADADVDVLGEPRTILETFGWIAHRVAVRGRSDAGRGRESCGLPRMGEFVRGRNGPSERIELMCSTHLQLNVVARLVNGRRRNLVFELLMTTLCLIRETPGIVDIVLGLFIHRLFRARTSLSV
jgi:hypothetical protein